MTLKTKIPLSSLARERKNFQMELTAADPIVSGKEPLATPSGSKGPCYVCLPSSVGLTNYHVVFLWKLDKQSASLRLFHFIREVEGRVL